MRVAMAGTRGVPARYGGFETAVEEVGRRLAERGHDVTVFCRGGDPAMTSYAGMQLIHVPAMKRRSAETLTHTVATAMDLQGRPGFDVALLFNAANSVTIPLFRRHARAIALHVDGLEWQRGKWGRLGRLWYLAMERYGANAADALIADAVGIQDYYEGRYGKSSHFLPYGAPLLTPQAPRRLAELGVASGQFHLVVARLEPENHVDVAIEGYRLADPTWPLLVVGSVPYETEYTRRLTAAAAGHSGIRMIGAVWDEDLLNELFAHAGCYVHGHSVGGTNPVLLRAMGAAAPVVAWDVVFNREVLGDTGTFYGGSDALALLLTSAETEQEEFRRRGAAGRARAAELYDWTRVTDGYEQLCIDLLDRVPQ
jgi:glycosyltransferase involved in cell wall biosynthesis